MYCPQMTDRGKVEKADTQTICLCKKVASLVQRNSSEIFQRILMKQQWLVAEVHHDLTLKF